ncbi:MAG TPA: DUF4293 domain-containing protein [Bacteroidia bacterium]|nr:DUF4293 domain-containing protein [Bacteroidia bacterium]
MIQRIQTLFLFLTDIVLVVLFFVPFMLKFDDKSAAAGVPVTLLDFPLAIVGQGAICVIAALAVTQFKNRALQLKICFAGIVLSVFYTGALAAIPTILNDGNERDFAHYEIAYGTWISLANIVLFYLARVYIQKDEDLVKSVDRLR